jgi:hypothetical protein
MGKISGYALDSTPNLGDKLIGTDVDNMNATKNFTIGQVLALGAPISYKVYTGLLTQTGVSNPLSITAGTLTIGVTYVISGSTSLTNFTNVGAPSNTNGVYFVATGTTPTNFGGATLSYDTGAPTVKVLHNTVGNIYFRITGNGVYRVGSDNLFTANKTTVILGPLDFSSSIQPAVSTIQSANTTSNYYLCTNDGSGIAYNGLLTDTPIEIRVYI